MTTEMQPTESKPSVDPKLIQELFDKDPLKLTQQDLDIIIGEFRAGRMAYLTPPEATSKSTPRTKSGKKAVVELDLNQIDLEDLLGPKKEG